MRKFIILFLCVIFIAHGLLAQTASNEQKNEADTAKNWVERMYAVVLPAIQENHSERYIKQYTSVDFYNLYKMVQQMDRDEIGLFDAEFWTDSKDPEENLKAIVKSVPIDNHFPSDEYAYVAVNAYLFSIPSAPSAERD